MSNYIHFSPEQKDKAYHMDIAELLRKQGEKLNRCGNEYIWESPTGKVTQVKQPHKDFRINYL